MASDKDKRYRVAGNRVVTDDQGRQFGPGDVIDVLPASEHNDALVNSGDLVEMDPAPKRGRPKKSETEAESESEGANE